MNKTKLHFISHCGKVWLVGINGKDITNCKTTGGKEYFAIGNDEIDGAKKLGKISKCKVCKKSVRVEVKK